MAKQTGNIRATGTVQGITFYKMDGKHFARTKSSLEGKRVKKDPAFKPTMNYAKRLGKASKLSSKAYSKIKILKKKDISFFRKLTGISMRMMNEGKKEEEIELQLNQEIMNYLNS